MSFKKKKKRKPQVKARTKSNVLPANFFTAFENKARIKAEEETWDFAEDIAEEARTIILEQRYKWAPLSPGYKAYKEREGLDPRKLIATGDYVDNIGAYEKEGKIFVGPLPGIHEESGLTYVHLSRIHEYGTETIPARPLWRPLASKVLRKYKKLRKKYQAAVKKDYRNEVRRRTKKVKQKA